MFRFGWTVSGTRRDDARKGEQGETVPSMHRLLWLQRRDELGGNRFSGLGSQPEVREHTVHTAPAPLGPDQLGGSMSTSGMISAVPNHAASRRFSIFAIVPPKRES